MGSYKCKLAKILKPKNHDEWHGDFFSSVCPILRDEIEKAGKAINYERLQRLLKLGIDAGQIDGMFEYRSIAKKRDLKKEQKE